MTTPCPGTVALIVPRGAWSSRRDHRFVQRVAGGAGLPIAAAVVLMVAADAFSLNSTTDTSPLASGLASTSRPPEAETSVPCLPSESWSTAMTSLLLRIDSVVALAPTQVVAGDQRRGHLGPQAEVGCGPRCADMPLPTSSMSGSFQPPGPA